MQHRQFRSAVDVLVGLSRTCRIAIPGVEPESDNPTLEQFIALMNNLKERNDAARVMLKYVFEKINNIDLPPDKDPRLAKLTAEEEHQVEKQIIAMASDVSKLVTNAVHPQRMTIQIWEELTGYYERTPLNRDEPHYMKNFDTESYRKIKSGVKDEITGALASLSLNMVPILTQQQMAHGCGVGGLN